MKLDSIRGHYRLLLAVFVVGGSNHGAACSGFGDNSAGQNSAESKGIIIGIDIGSVYVSAAIVRNGSVAILKNDQGSERTPAYVAFSTGGRLLIGDEAKSQATANPSGTAFSILPLLGMEFDSDSVQRHARLVPYTVQRNHKNSTVIVLQRFGVAESFAPEEILAILLRKMRELAEQSLGGEKVTSVVISLPSCLSYQQLRAVRDAGRIAGFTNEALTLESTMAASVAYGFLTGARNRKLFVLDAGESTVGAGVTDFSDKGDATTEVHGCLREAGGDAFQQAVLSHLLDVFDKQHGKQLALKLRQDAFAMEKLRGEAERAVTTLSSSQQVRVQVESLINGHDFDELLSRSQFSNLIATDLSRIRKLMNGVLKDTDLKVGDINDVALIGGLGHIPAIRKLTKSLFNDREPISLGADPSMSAVIGAAVHAYDISSSDSPAMVTLSSGTFGYRTSANGAFVLMLQRGEVIPSYNSNSAAGSVGRKASTFAVEVQEHVLQENGTSGYQKIGTVTVEIPPTSVLELVISFRMEKYHKLQVSVLEITTDTEKVVDFSHGLSQFQMQGMGRRCKALLREQAKGKEEL